MRSFDKTTTIIGICLMSLLFIYAAIPTTKEPPKVFVNKEAKIIEKYIGVWSKYGYRVQSISCQSIAKGSDYSLEKGDIILIMTK